MYLSKEITVSAFKELKQIDSSNDGKSARERTSGLQYFFATAEVLKKNDLVEIDLSPSRKVNRDDFIQAVGRVVKLNDSGLYSNNFGEEFSDALDYKVRNNFLTSSLKRDGNYPGRPAPLIKRQSEKISLFESFKANLLQYGDWDDYRIALAIWLVRFDVFTSNDFLTINDLSIAIRNKLMTRYGEDIANILILNLESLNEKLSPYLENLSNPTKSHFDSLRKADISSPSTTPIEIGKNLILFGAPGTGKSYKIKSLLKGKEDQTERVTFHPDYDYASFVGGYKPVSEAGDIKYKFVPQAFTYIYVRAWQNQGQAFYLIIEEINRGNCAEVFGDIFQLLDRSSPYPITPSKELLEYLVSELGKDALGIEKGKMQLPPNLNIFATMNTSDQSLYPMDSAFKRRWEWEYLPINYNEFDSDGEENNSFHFQVELDENLTFKWVEFIQEVNARIKNNPNLGMDKCIGNYFLIGKENKIELNQFINKAIFYLWNDVFKDEEEGSIFAENSSYEDFFPIQSNGKEKVKGMLDRLGISIVNASETSTE